MFDKILYPTDFSDVAQKALAYLKGLRGAGTKRVILLWVISDKKMECIQQGIALAGKEVASFLKQAYRSLQDEALKKVKPIAAELSAAGFEVSVLVETGVPGLKILEIAEAENVSAIMMGSHGRSNIGAVLLGSVSDHVIRHSKCPVIVIKRDAKPSKAG